MQTIKKIVIASHNQGKIAEFRKMLAPLEIEVCSAQDLSLPDVEETGILIAVDEIREEKRKRHIDTFDPTK